MKKIVSLLLVFTLIFNAFTFVSAEEGQQPEVVIKGEENVPTINENANPEIKIDKISKEEFDINIKDENINLIEEPPVLKVEEDIVLKIDELNFYKPVEIIHLKDNQYQIELADILFDYGEVRLHIVGDGEDIPFSKIVKNDQKIKFILNSDDYNCEILITDEIADSRITFIGKIVAGQYELKWIDESTYSNNSSAKDISTQAVKREIESNNTMTTANTIVAGDDMYGTMSTDREDYYKISFPTAGKANFWLGQIPSSKNHNLYVYQNTSLIGSDTRTGLTQKLIQKDVSSGTTTYYVRVSYPSGTLPTGYDYWLRVKLYVNLAWPTSSTIGVNYCFGTNCPKYGGWHNGIDLGAPMNSSVKASGAGSVTWSGRASDTSTLATYGKYIDLVHTYDNPLSTGADNQFIKTRYAHLDLVDKSVGSVVSVNTQIGESGKTGYSKEVGKEPNYEPYLAHLHFEVLTGPSKTGSTWNRVNPLLYFPGKTCNACGKSYSIVPTDIYNIPNIRSIGIAVNNEYFIDIESLLSMKTEDLIRYGISDDKVLKFDELLKSDEKIYEKYNNQLKMLIN